MGRENFSIVACVLQWLDLGERGNPITFGGNAWVRIFAGQMSQDFGISLSGLQNGRRIDGCGFETRELARRSTMNWAHRITLCMATFGVLGISSASYGQAPMRSRFTPLSNIGGHTGQEMAGIYNEAMGSGYSVQSLNSIALSNARARGGYSGQPTAPAPQPRINLQPAGGATKPFSGFSPSPTTSPYLNLFREDFAGESDLNYNTLVRPQIQQQQFNQQVQRQGQEMARRMQQMAAKSDFSPQGDQNQYPTGHQTVFGYYGHFHPRAAYTPRR